MTQDTHTPADKLQETIRQIRESKASYLSRVFNALLLQEKAVEDFRVRHDEHSYIDFLGKFHERFELVQGESPLIAQDPKPLYPEFVADLSDKLSEIGQTMQRIDYQPPEDREGQLIHLKAMWHLLNEDCAYPPTTGGFCLDFSFSKLTIRVQQNLMSDAIRGEREEPRIKAGIQQKQKIAKPRKDIVLAIYEHGESIVSGKRLSEVIEIIKGQFEKSREDKEAKWGAIPPEMEFPGRDSIIIWLREEGILARDFEKKGRYWFKNI